MIRVIKETGLFAPSLSLALAFALPAAALAASAPRPAPAFLASVDANGRVTPSSGQDKGFAPISSIAPQTVAGSACPTTTSLSKVEARALVLSVAQRENFFPDFVVAVAETESHFDAAALSPKGAYGLMQLEPETARRFDVDLCDPAGNVLGGVRYLRYLHDRYRNPIVILSAYNAGEEAMLSHGGVPPFPETVRFVADVLNAFYEWPRPELSAAARSRPSSVAAAPGPIIESFGDAPDPAQGVGAARTDGAVRHWD